MDLGVKQYMDTHEIFFEELERLEKEYLDTLMEAQVPEDIKSLSYRQGLRDARELLKRMIIMVAYEEEYWSRVLDEE